MADLTHDEIVASAERFADDLRAYGRPDIADLTVLGFILREIDKPALSSWAPPSSPYRWGNE